MKKKFAYILMGAQYCPETHHAEFETENEITFIFTVRNFAEAKERAFDCAANGFGVVELCGAFSQEKAQELLACTRNKMGVGFSIHLPEQDDLFRSFFS